VEKQIKSFTRNILIRALLIQVAVCGCLSGSSVFAQIKVKEYHAFHEVLHPLEHEAVPAKDWQRIRTHADELVERGKAIVKLGVPAGTAEKHLREFRKELRKFDDALKQFDRHAKKGNDTEVETSFASVHDSFEMLLGMIP